MERQTDRCRASGEDTDGERLDRHLAGLLSRPRIRLSIELHGDIIATYC